MQIEDAGVNFVNQTQFVVLVLYFRDHICLVVDGEHFSLHKRVVASRLDPAGVFHCGQSL
jgi:hypothetical protein